MEITETDANTGILAGRVSEEERDQIKTLHERRVALTEFVRGLASGSDPGVLGSALYEKIVKDMGETSLR
jgi:CXXX repeat modification system protein